MEYNFSDRSKHLDGTATREIFKLLSRPEIISFAGGLPANDYLPVKEIAQITDEILSSDIAKKMLQYGTTEGFPFFREKLIGFVGEMGIENLSLENTLVISGGQQGIDLMIKAFINKGDKVLVEDPTYLAFLQILKSYEGVPVGVKSDENGLDLADLEEKIKTEKPKMLYVVPTFSNPTGKTYTEENRKKIAEITAKYGVIVVEDDPYGRLRYEGKAVKSLKSFDIAGNIVYITSFSKILSPGLRVGVAVGDKALIRKLTICKQGADLHTSNISQLIADKYLEKGYIAKNVKNSLPVYKKRKDAMMNAIKKYMPSEFAYTDPEGGLFVWGGFKSDLDTKALLPKAIERDVAYIQGSEFYANPIDGKRFLRLNYSNESEERIDKGIKNLGDLYKELIAKL